MSTVSSSTDSGNSYYRDASRIEDQIHKEAQLTRQKNDEQVKKLEERYHTSLEKKDQEIAQTVENLRDSAENSLKGEREKYKESLERIRENTYNNRGTTTSGEEYRKAFEDYKNSNDILAKNLQEKNEARLNEIEKNHRADRADIEKKTTETFENYKTGTEETFNRDRKTYAADLDALKKQNYDMRGQVKLSVPIEVYKTQVQDLMANSDKRHENDVKAIEDFKASSNANVEALNRKSELRIQNLATSHSDNIQDLERQVGVLSDHDRMAQKQRAEAIEQITRDNETTNKLENQRQQNAYEAQIDHLKQDGDRKDVLFSRRTNDILQEKEKQWSDLVQRQNLENYRMQSSTDSQYRDQLNSIEKEKKLSQDRAATTLENVVSKKDLERNAALSDQTKVYSENLAREKASSQDEINNLNRALQTRRSGTDSSLPPAGLEASLRKTLINEYEKSLHAEVDRNKTSNEESQRKYTENYQRALEESAEKTAAITRQQTSDMQNERANFKETIMDSEDHSNARLITQEQDNNRERDMMLKQFGAALEKQRKEFERSYAASREDASLKYSALMHDTDMSNKMMQKAFTSRLTELSRETERKLTDQKLDNDARYEDLKTQAQVDLRDAEQKAKVELDQQAKNYELRIAQMEAQNKEREKIVAQNHLDELDRTRRSYELSNKKKS